MAVLRPAPTLHVLARIRVLVQGLAAWTRTHAYDWYNHVTQLLGGARLQDCSLLLSISSTGRAHRAGSSPDLRSLTHNTKRRRTRIQASA